MSSTQDVSAGINGELSVGMVGYSFMGAAHSQAWRSAPRFFDLPLRLRMTALAGRDTQRVAQAAGRLGWESTETSWQALVARDDVDLIDVCTPGDTHAEIAIAALEAGKHVLCEKPLANSVEEAEAMTAAAEKAAANGVRSMVGFTYRRVPAIALARQLVAEGQARDAAPRAGAVPPGLDRRPGGTAVVAPGQDARQARARSATSVPTSSTSPSSSPATRSPASPAACAPSSTSDRCRASTPG